jgi:hypothetical protein
LHTKSFQYEKKV